MSAFSRAVNEAREAARRVRRRPIERVRTSRWSAIAPLADQPNERLLDLATMAIEAARRENLAGVVARCRSTDEKRWVQQWPGEHYRLLAGITRSLGARHVVEIGTFTGLSSLSFTAALPADGKVVTYDILPWRDVPDTALRQDDFDDRLEQRIGDLSDPTYFAAELETLSDADVVLVDGPKDRRFERAFLDLALPKLRGTGCLVILDDIRLVAMIDLWQNLEEPRLDLTSFGHWSGTGLVDCS